MAHIPVLLEKITAMPEFREYRRLSLIHIFSGWTLISYPRPRNSVFTSLDNIRLLLPDVYKRQFFYCTSLEDFKSLTDKDGEDFTVAGCLDFGIYEELLQTT